MKIKEGFKYKGFKYGWSAKKLYRLPGTKEGRQYQLRELPKIKVGNQSGFRICRDRKTVAQVVALTEKVTWIVPTKKCKECA